MSCVTEQGDIYIQCQGPGLQQLEQVADHIEEQYGKVRTPSTLVSCVSVHSRLPCGIYIQHGVMSRFVSDTAESGVLGYEFHEPSKS